MEALLCAFNIIQFDRLTEMLTITNKLASWSKKFKFLTCSSSIRYHCMFLIFQKFLRYSYEKNLLIGTRSFCIFEISHERQIFILIAGILVQLTPSTIYLQQLKLTLQGFPFGFDQCPHQGHFEQNGQKLHEYYKINIFEAKQQVEHGRQANFLDSGWRSTQVHPLGDTLY